MGALGRLPFPAGFFVYLGSALGPGGLRARLAHHLRAAGRPHWHLDYLRAEAECVGVWLLTGLERRECTWAQELGLRRQATLAAPGFGASDCSCRSHLYHFARRPRLCLSGSDPRFVRL